MEPALTGSPPIKVSNDEVPRLSVANQNAVTAAAVVLVVIVLALVTAISVILARFMKWRRNRGEESYELAQGKYSTHEYRYNVFRVHCTPSCLVMFEPLMRVPRRVCISIIITMFHNRLKLYHVMGFHCISISII